MRKHWDTFPNCPFIHIEIPRWIKIEKTEKLSDKGCFKEISVWFAINFCCYTPKFHSDIDAMYAKIDVDNEAIGYFRKKRKNLWKTDKKNYFRISVDHSRGNYVLFTY